MPSTGLPSSTMLFYLYSTKELGQPRTSTSNIEDNKIDSTRVADFYNIADNRSNYINRGSQLNNQWHSWWLRSSVLQRNNLPHDVQTVVTAGPGAENALGIFPVFRIGRTFTVTFDAGDGTPSEASREYATTTTTYGTLPTITTSPEGKTFAGWYTAAEGGEKVEDNDAFISNDTHTLYAQWEETVQLVTFDDAYSAAGKTKVNNYYTMQDMDSSICNAVTTPVNTDNSDAMTTQLLDTRNNKVYGVGKLVDGRCWLLDNLSLDLTDADVQDNLTEDTTNASNTTLGYLKNGGGGGADQYAMSGATIWTTSYNYAIPYIITAYSDTTGSGGYEAGKYGVYYTYCAATAGSYCYGGSPNYYNYGNASGDATEDICPKGWRLPTGGNSGETNTVSLAYNSDRTSVINALHAPFSGDAVYGYNASSGQQKINLYQGTAAHFWSSTFGDSTYMRSFAISETELVPSSSHYRTNATSVRCVAK